MQSKWITFRLMGKKKISFHLFSLATTKAAPAPHSVSFRLCVCLCLCLFQLGTSKLVFACKRCGNSSPPGKHLTCPRLVCVYEQTFINIYAYSWNDAHLNANLVWCSGILDWFRPVNWEGGRSRDKAQELTQCTHGKSVCTTAAIEMNKAKNKNENGIKQEK